MAARCGRWDGVAEETARIAGLGCSIADLVDEVGRTCQEKRDARFSLPANGEEKSRPASFEMTVWWRGRRERRKRQEAHLKATGCGAWPGTVFSSRNVGLGPRKGGVRIWCEGNRVRGN